jgi:hypothetical protein
VVLSSQALLLLLFVQPAAWPGHPVFPASSFKVLTVHTGRPALPRYYYCSQSLPCHLNHLKPVPLTRCPKISPENVAPRQLLLSPTFSVEHFLAHPQTTSAHSCRASPTASPNDVR